MNKRRFILLSIIVLLVPAGMALAQTSTNYSLSRFVTVAGGSADSTSYSVTSVMGQPNTKTANSPNFKVSGGFLIPKRQEPVSNKNIWLPIIQTD